MIDAFALQLVLSVLTGWLDRQEQEVLRYLIEENRLLRRQLRGRRLQLTHVVREPAVIVGATSAAAWAKPRPCGSPERNREPAGLFCC